MVSGGVLGADAAWPQSRKHLQSGNLMWVAPGVKMGIVNIYEDETAEVEFFGGKKETFFSSYATLRVGEPVTEHGATVTMVEAQSSVKPRWIRVVAEQGAR